MRLHPKLSSKSFRHHVVVWVTSMAVITILSFAASSVFASSEPPHVFMAGSELPAISSLNCENVTLGPELSRLSESAPIIVAGVIICPFCPPFCVVDPTTIGCVVCWALCGGSPI